MQYCSPCVCYLPYLQWGWHYVWPHVTGLDTAAADCLYCYTCRQPISLCSCETPKTSQKVPQEMLVDSTTPTQQTFIGGLENVSLTLEYMQATGATSPQVTVSITEDGNTAQWSISDISDGYQIKSDFGRIPPGSLVVLEVTDCVARLRWCEAICC